jgi:hypothetical protein
LGRSGDRRPDQDHRQLEELRPSMETRFHPCPLCLTIAWSERNWRVTVGRRPAGGCHRTTGVPGGEIRVTRRGGAVRCQITRVRHADCRGTGTLVRRLATEPWTRHCRQWPRRFQFSAATRQSMAGGTTRLVPRLRDGKLRLSSGRLGHPRIGERVPPSAGGLAARQNGQVARSTLPLQLHHYGSVRARLFLLAPTAI